MAQVIIFDWGRTLYDPDIGTVFPEVPGLLANLKHKYQLAIVCLASDGDFDRRIRVMTESGIKDLFALILMAESDKDTLYQQAMKQLGCEPAEIVIVDDRVIRGVRWGNQNGARTIWLKRGKFAEELPNEETGKPYRTISYMGDLAEIL